MATSEGKNAINRIFGGTDKDFFGKYINKNKPTKQEVLPMATVDPDGNLPPIRCKDVPEHYEDQLH